LSGFRALHKLNEFRAVEHILDDSVYLTLPWLDSCPAIVDMSLVDTTVSETTPRGMTPTPSSN
jgi:hypothetical protein